MDNKTFEELLAKVQKPAQYLGNEWNAVRKDLSSVDIKFALIFPELYELGMSNMGFKLIYHLLNERKDLACERVFAPAIDMEELLRKNNIPLFSLESKLPLKDFDIIGFSLAYEMTFTNVLNILDMARIPLKRCERTSADPLIIAGGVSSFNPEPMSDFIDVFVIGEAEEVILEFIDKFKEFQKEGDRKKLLEALSGIKGVYVPSLYKTEYKDDGTIKKFSTSNPSIPSSVEKRFIKNLNTAFYPTKQIVPFTRIIHDRISLEIMRGCPNKCRFCQARVNYHYKRERSAKKIVELALESERFTGYEEVSLLSLSSGDHSEIEKIISELVDKCKPKGISISLPSLRIDKALKEFPSVLSKVGISGLTFAPEAGSERLRNIINKDIDIKNLKHIAAEVRKSGWRKIKLYFMIGLPGETDEDLKIIPEIVNNLKGEINVSVSSFVPKPHTPFQWACMQPFEELRRKFLFLKDNMSSRRIKLSFHNPNLSFIEAVLSRGDRRVGEAILAAFKSGAKFDGWTEHFKFDTWREAFKASSVDPEFYVYRKRPYDELLPWDCINPGMSKEYLIKESQQADLAMLQSN